MSAPVACGLSSVWSMSAAISRTDPSDVGGILHDIVRARYDEKTMETAVATPAASVIDLEAKYLFQNYARYPLVLHRGKGCYVYDTSGKRYLDLIAGIGVNALGHAHPRLMKVIREQAGRMLHSSNLYYHEYQGPLAERIAKATGLERV